MAACRLIMSSKSEEEIGFLWTDMHTQAKMAINPWPCNMILVVFLFLKHRKNDLPKPAAEKTSQPALYETRVKRFFLVY